MHKYDFSTTLLDKTLNKSEQTKAVADMVRNQTSFDELFALTLQHERSVVSRAVNALVKVSERHPEFLKAHKIQLLNIMVGEDHKHIKAHIPQLITKIYLDENELENAWHILTYWLKNRNEKKLIRAKALQGLYDLATSSPSYKQDLQLIIAEIESEMIPILQTRISKIKDALCTTSQ